MKGPSLGTQRGQITGPSLRKLTVFMVQNILGLWKFKAAHRKCCQGGINKPGPRKNKSQHEFRDQGCFGEGITESQPCMVSRHPRGHPDQCFMPPVLQPWLPCAGDGCIITSDTGLITPGYKPPRHWGLPRLEITSLDGAKLCLPKGHILWCHAEQRNSSSTLPLFSIEAVFLGCLLPSLNTSRMNTPFIFASALLGRTEDRNLVS